MKAPRVLFAIDNEAERQALIQGSEAEGYGASHFPTTITEVEALVSADAADVIVTDFRFHSGAFADWLVLWPLPVVLIVDPDDPIDRVERTLHDESSLFILRDPSGAYLSRIPLLVRKVNNIRESLRRQNAHLQFTEHQYLNLLQAIPDIVYTLDNEGRFLYLNDSIRNLGYDPSKLIGKHFSEIIHPSDVPQVSRTLVLRSFRGVSTGADSAPKLFDERRSGLRMTRNLELRLRPGAAMEGYRYATVNAYGEVSSVGWELPEYEGVEMGTVGIIRDITLRKEHELALEKALAAKEVLLKEIHHRVKNNLQVVSSLLSLQENVVDDLAARKVFLECQNQIQSMAMVHEVLYRSANFEGVEMQAYFERLTDYLGGVYDAAYRGIESRVDAGGILLDLDDAIPIALIVNELVSNAFKHAFPGSRKGSITVAMSETATERLLVVSDDGVGAEGSRKASLDEPGLGSELIAALSAQIKGRLTVEDASGFTLRMSFPRRDPSA